MLELILGGFVLAVAIGTVAIAYLKRRKFPKPSAPANTGWPLTPKEPREPEQPF